MHPFGFGNGGLLDPHGGSLIDRAMAPQQQQQAAPPQIPQLPQQPGPRPLQGAAGLVASLFGAPDPRLSPQQQRQMQSQALIAAGSQLADDPGNFAGAVGRAIQTGRKTHQERMAEMDKRLHDRRVERLLDSGDFSPEKLQGLAISALAHGDPAEAKILSDMAAQFGGDSAQIDVFDTADEFGNPVRMRVNKVTGSVISTTPLELTGTELKKFQASQANELRDDFERSIGADAQQVASAYGRVQSAPSSPAGDIGLIFNIMKMFDPGSVVREGEFATAASAASVPEQIRNLYNRVLQGTRLTDTQREDFRNTAAALAQQARQQLQPALQRYSEIAARQGADPRDVVYDPFEQLDIAVPTAAAAEPAVDPSTQERADELARRAAERDE